ncbi:MAG: hypothetical protein U5K54_05975 [Cytophagales bacterium]|nr:hypothetical protein [Cytophagales bacterium]
MKTGKVKQVAAFGKLVGICNDLGASYNPSKAALTPTALATLLEQAQQNLEAVNVARTNFVLAINARQESYAGIYKLVSRVVRAVASAESSTRKHPRCKNAQASAFAKFVRQKNYKCSSGRD